MFLYASPFLGRLSIRIYKMADQATAKYLNDNIGPVLSKALSDMAVQQPSDAVDFLSQWLKTHAEQEEAKMVREKEEAQTEKDRVLTQKNEAEKAARREQKAASKQSIDDAYQTLLDKFSDEEKMFEDSYWSELVNVAKQYMGAQSVYLGLLDEEGLEDVEAPLIRYLNENVFAGSPSLLDKVLPKMKDAETSNLTYGALTESLPEEELAQRCIWKPTPPPQPPVPEGEEPPPAPEGPKYLPVSVPCVTDVPIVHYFEMPRLGAYLATPLVYPSYYTQEAFGEARKFETEKAEAAKALQEKMEEREAQIKEAQEKGLEEPTFEEEEAQPEKVMELPGTTTKMVLCMDTLGTNTLFDESKYQKMMDLCDACAACKARSEIREIDDQALFTINVERRALADDSESGLPKLKEDARTALQELQDAEMKEISERGLEADKKGAVEELCGKKFAFLQAKMVIDNYKDSIKSFVKMGFTAEPELLNILAAIAFLAGYSKPDVYPARKTMLKWPKIKSLFADDKESEQLFGRIEAISLDVGRKNLTSEQKLAAIQGMLPAEFNEEKAKEIDPSVEVLWSFLTAALDYRTSTLKQAQVDFEERKKKAEEEEATFDEPDLTTLDDDFEGLAGSA